MNHLAFLIFIAMLAGIFTVVQSQLMGFIDKNMGTFEVGEFAQRVGGNDSLHIAYCVLRIIVLRNTQYAIYMCDRKADQSHLYNDIKFNF